MKEILESKNKKIFNNFTIKLKGKGIKLLSKSERNKDVNDIINIDNKTEKSISNNNNYINDEQEGEIGVPILNSLKENKQKEKLKTIRKINVSNLKRNPDNNIYIHNTISSCRNSITNGNIHFFRSPNNGKIIKRLGNNSNSLRSLKTSENSNDMKIKYSFSSMNNNNIINQSNITNYINNINNNIIINTNNNNSYINPENRIYKKKYSFKKIYKNSLNNNDENIISQQNEMFNNQIIQKSNKPKTIRLKKLELFKIPIYNNKIKLKNKFNNNKKNNENNEMEND